MVIGKIKTSKGDLYVVGKNENDIRDKANKYLKNRFFSEIVNINSVDILACSDKFYSDNTLIL